MKAGRAIGIMATVVLLAFALAVVGCAGPQEQAPGAAGGKQAARSVRA